jgi:double-strand break repair protein MRE11
MESQGESDDADTIRCLIITDNHVGYLERDPVRGDDSFRTFEECLQIGRQQKVDCILHAGDLFHHNKPSRKCLFRTSELLKRYTFGENPVALELLTRPEDNFTVPVLNYMDPNLNVDIPVFAIHGNHDDPAGDGALSAMDLLANVGLINYFGKHQQVDNLQVTPVLLRKGQTQFALYGMGNVRDERLHRAFAEKRVQMLQPNLSEEEQEDLFSLMLIHQNRVQHGAKNYVAELMLPEWLDLIVWGHEHECLVKEQKSAGRDFYVTQPGSSVATSLIVGESKDKHVAVLEINRGRFQLKPIPLTTVRPFVIDDFNVTAENVPKDAKSLQKALVAKVGEMIERAKEQNADMLPLIRLNVELGEGYDKIPPQRFGAEFVGRVANPDDLVAFSKKQRKPDITEKNARSEAAILAARTSRVAGAKQSVEQEVSRILAGRAKHMCALPERHLGIALSEYVDKEDSKAFETMLDDSIKNIRALVLQRAKESGIVDLTADVVRSFAEERVKEEDAKEAPVQYDMLAVIGEPHDVDADDEEVAVARGAVKKEPAKKRAAPKKTAGAAASKAKAPAAKKKKVLAFEDEEDEEDDDFDEDGEVIVEVKPKKKAPAAAARVKREAIEVDLVDEDDDEPKARPPQQKKAATKPKSPAKRSAAATATLTSQHFDDDDLNKPLSFRKKK